MSSCSSGVTRMRKEKMRGTASSVVGVLEITSERPDCQEEGR